MIISWRVVRYLLSRFSILKYLVIIGWGWVKYEELCHTIDDKGIDIGNHVPDLAIIS